MSQATVISQEGGACAQALLDSIRATNTAWTRTTMFSLVRQKQVLALRDAFFSPDPSAVPSLLVDMAGPSYDAYALKSGFDVKRIMKLSSLTLSMLCKGRDACSTDPEIIQSLYIMRDRAHHWISGLDMGDTPGAEDLRKVDDLIASSPSLRLALVAPYGPAIGSSLLVMRACSAGFEFSTGG